MFIREVKKQRSISSKVFYQYNLVQSSRVDGKVKQRVILYLGSDIELRDKDKRNKVLQVLKSKIFGQPDLFPLEIDQRLKKRALSYYEKYLVRYELEDEVPTSIPPLPEKAEFLSVDIRGVEVEDVKNFGAEHLCRQVLEKMKLADCLHSLGMDATQIRKALIAIAARAIFSGSEHKTAQWLEMNSALAECYGHSSPITYKQLYSISDKLYQHKDKIDPFLYQRLTGLFDIEDKLVIFDISNTYFETNKSGSRVAKYGRSKEKRNDCPLVVFSGVINAAGFIRHSRIYEGNRSDLNTLSEMIEDLEAHSNSREKKTVVMDAGIATEENLAMLRKKNYDYVCVSRKRLKDYSISDQVIELTDRGKHKVKLSILHPEDTPDTWMYVQSDLKQLKEQSMHDKLSERFEQDLDNIKAAFSKKSGTKKIEKVWERIGRAKQKHHRVSGRYEITVENKDGKATDMFWNKKPDPVKEDKQKGIYFIRTSYQSPSEKELWSVYNTIREVESTFRCLKTDLRMRPVFHQKDQRIEAHLYLTLLAYQLVNTIRYMLRQNNLRYDWRNILRMMSTQTIQNIILPTDKKRIHLRKPSKPIKEVQQIYQATGCTHTQKAIKKYVVYH